MGGDQLGLLLWKNYVIRKRQPGMLALVLLWPVLVFLVLYAVRDNTDPEYNPTCQFPSRLMPQNDFLPFLQNFICTLGNPCEPLSRYEEVPSYQSAKLGPLLRELQPLIKNETVLNATQALPKSLKFVRSMAEVLTRPGVKKIFEKGIRLGDLFNDHDEIKDFLRREVPTLDPALVNSVLNASIKMQYLVEAFGSSNMDGIVCTPESLKQFLILPTEGDLPAVSRALCSLNSTLMPDLLQLLTEQLDFNGLFNMVNLVMAKFSNYDVFTDLQQTTDSILGLKMVDLYVPENLKLREWLPKIILLFKNVTFKEIDLSFINNAVDILDPIFREERDWGTARKAFLKLNSILEMAKDIIHNKTVDKLPPNSVFRMTNDILENLNDTFYSHESFGEIIDTAWEVLQGGTKLTKVLLYDYDRDIELSVEVLDGLRNFFSSKILNTVSYIISLSDIAVKALHHIAIIHQESSARVWNITQKYSSLVRPLLTMNPSVYGSVVQSFSRLDFVENFTLVESNKIIGEVFCDKEMLGIIFNDFKDLESKDSETILTVLCSEEGQRFLTEIYDSFDLDNFESLVRKLLSTFVYAAAGVSVPMTDSNLTTVVRSIKEFSTYMEIPRSSEKPPDWGNFSPTNVWAETFENTSAQGRLDILGIHLSIAKKMGKRSLSRLVVERSLEKMSLMASSIIQVMQSEPIDWVQNLGEALPQMIDTFYLSFANSSKVLNILEISNYTHTFCEARDPQGLIVYPKGSNETFLKHEICQFFKYVECGLLYGFQEKTESLDTYLHPGSFNWTLFNEQVITIYTPIDTLIHEKYPGHNITQRKLLQDQLTIAWSKNISVRDGWELSIGLLCKLGDMLENSVYGIRHLPSWNNVRAMAEMLSHIFNTFQERVNIVMNKNGTSQISLNLMPETGILEEVILRNLDDVVNDAADMITLNLPNISAIIDYKKRVTDWPCVREQSVGEVLGIRNGTRKVVREIERIACNPGLFIKEWEQLLFEDNDTTHIHEKPFNWTEGYKKFRHLVDNLTELSQESTILWETPKVSFADIKVTFETAKKFIDSKFTDTTIWNDILTNVDNKLNDLMGRTDNFTMATDDIFYRSYNIDPLSRISAFAKYAGHVIHEISAAVLSILNKGPEFETLTILGFHDKSPVKIVYTHLPGLVATIVSGLSSSSLMRKISLAQNNPYGGPTCTDVFDWFVEFRVGISREDYRILKNFTCDGDPVNFNIVRDVISSELALSRQPAISYPLFAGRSILKLYELGAALKKISDTGIKIKPPFSIEYWDHFAKNLTWAFKQHRVVQGVSTEKTVDHLDLAVELVSELSKHLAASLRDVRKNELKNEFHLWDLVEDGDARQLLKHLETYPTESISLAATLARINLTTGNVIPFRELTNKMCKQHFGSRFWNETKRSHFLTSVCSFDPRQLLRSITSQQFADLIESSSHKIREESPLSEYLVDAMEALYNLSLSKPQLVFKTNLFNITTWRNLDNASWSIINNSEESWLRYHLNKLNNESKTFHSLVNSSSDFHVSYGISNYYKLLKASQNMDIADASIQISSLVLDLLSGGDVWSKIRTIYERNPEMKVVLSLVEDLPNLIITIVNSFFNVEITKDNLYPLLMGKIKLCEVDKYLVEPKYIRKKGFLGSFSYLCQQTWDNTNLTAHPVELIGLFNNKSSFTTEKDTELAMTHLNRLQSIIRQILSEGYKEFKIPTYWTSFLAGNFKDFVAEYQAMEPRVLLNVTTRQTLRFFQNALQLNMDSVNVCHQCGDVTDVLHLLNEQLSKYETYIELVCSFEKLDFDQMRILLFRNLNWLVTINKILGVTDPDFKRNNTVAAMVMEMEKTIYYSQELILGLFSSNNSSESLSQLDCRVDKVRASKPTTYINLLRIVLTLLYEHISVVDTQFTHSKLLKLGRMAEKNVPIWISIEEVVKSSDTGEIKRLLGGSYTLINVNMLDVNFTRNEADYYEILVSKRSTDFLQYSDTSADVLSISEISRQLEKSLDPLIIQRKIAGWREEATTNLFWLKEILRKLDVILVEVGNLLDVTTAIDFSGDISKTPRLYEDIVRLLREETIDKFFDGLNELYDRVEPFITDPVVKADTRTALVMFESMEIFKNLGLLNTKYAIKRMIPNWPIVRSYLIGTVGLSESITKILGQGKVDMLSVYAKERKAVSLSETICSVEKLGEILEFKSGESTVEEISKSLCQLSTEQAQNITIHLIKKLKFATLFKDIMSASVKNILSNANLNEKEGAEIIKNLGFVAKLVPILKDTMPNVSDEFSADYLISAKIESPTPAKKMDFGQFLADTGHMLCGQPVVEDTGRFFKVISKIEEKGAEFNEQELASLPTDFCRDVYKDVSKMGAGKILWTYVKPLLRGKILYTPRTNVIDKVMSDANMTFTHIENFGLMIDSFEKSMSSLANLTELGDNLKDLQKVLSSDLMKMAIKSFSGPSVDINLENFDLGKLAWRMKNSKTLIDTIQMINKLMDCVLVDRMVGFTTEKELEEEASRLIKTNDFLAGVVFIDGTSGRTKRSYEHGLPDNITYKIRMDVDSVPSTSRLKNQFWTPGPDSSFVENLRYLRGFVQLQDSIDRALIKAKTQTKQEWKTVSQQMPYPCWKFLSFQSALYESQGLQVCFFFALMMCVGAAVRHIVWERESQNAMVMSVMGLKPWRNTFAWFITSMLELSLVAICIHIILITGKILPHSDPILVLLLLLDYVFASVSFCYMVSTMFSSASLAAVTTVILFLLTYMPYIIVIAMEASVNLAIKLLICLNMSTSFCYGCLYAVRKEVQGTGLTWGSLWDESSPGDPMSLGLVMLLIAFDGCLYAVIGYFITRYTNSGKGFHGLRSISLWWADTRAFYGRPSYLAFENQVYFTNDVVVPSSSTHQESETDVASLHTHDEKQVGVRFDDVRKVYPTESGECIAVDDFSIKLMEGEVTTLLGRNGAGKTTIIKMLTGMEAPTSGEIWLPNNNTGKPNIGVCPQNNVLIGCLTAREHMMFYARLKEIKNDYEANKDIDVMLTSMELNGQEDELVCRLSGGTQRRLCVCLAFLGSPNLVILDEPGSGVDPAARRRIWRLIDKHRVGRTVLLSTHHLDEADMLSDTVVIMHKGKILCSGSPLSLKLNYGQGYTVTVSFPEQNLRLAKENQDDSQISSRALVALNSVIEHVIPNAILNDVGDSEVNVILPFQREHGVSNDIAGAIKALEDNQQNLGFSHFNVECDTLERVFLDMCAHADGGHMYTKPLSLESLNSMKSIGLATSTDDIDLITDIPIEQPSYFRQAKALLKKRLWHFSRDWRAPLAALILPTLFVAVAMGFSLIRPPSDDQPPLVLTTKLYNTHPVYFYSIDSKRDEFQRHVSLQLHDRFGDDHAGAWQTSPNDTGTCDCLDGEQICQGLPPPFEGLIETADGRPTLDWIVSTQQQYIEKRYGGWSLSHTGLQDETDLFTVWYNNKGHHALPAYVNALNEAILRANGVFGHLTTINHPIKLSRDQLNRTSLLQHVADVGVALVLLVAFSLVGAQGAKELVRERMSEEKRILYLAGVRPLTYWTTALIWDLLVFALSILLAVIVFEIFGLPAYVAKDNLSSVCILLFLYAWAVIPFTHLAEKFFDDSSLSNMVLFCLNTFIGVLSLATILIIDILGKTQTAADVREFLHQLLLIFPQYALGDGLVQISTNDITANLLERFNMNTYKTPLSWELLGPHCLYLFMVGAVLNAINLIVECRGVPVFWKQQVSYQNIEEDEDVAKERTRVEKGLSNSVLKTIHLRKEYNSAYGKNVAVQDLSFGIQPGECFGLFGVNGAGKSTTFKMLTTEILPTAGHVILNERELGSGPLCTGDVGYCPQSDALDPFLTPHQSLTIHGEVAGLRNVSRAVEMTLKHFDLIKYAHQRIANLSGGNKRKLSTAISVMVPSRIVLMDEATSGMDPASKDLVARAIKSIVKNHGSVLMTSHSVSECENLCNRVGVLAKAGLKCIGSPQYLKHKYGEGYIVFLRFKSPTLLSDLLETTGRHLPGASIASRQAFAARLLVPRKRNIKLSTVFAKVKDLADELNAADYTLTQSSLDQVLVNFSEELDNERSFENRTANDSRSHSNSDAIHMDVMRRERFTPLPVS